MLTRDVLVHFPFTVLRDLYAKLVTHEYAKSNAVSNEAAHYGVPMQVLVERLDTKHCHVHVQLDIQDSHMPSSKKTAITASTSVEHSSAQPSPIAFWHN